MFNKSWLAGGATGFIFAALISIIAYTKLGDSSSLETAVQYASSVPVFIMMKVWPKAPDLFITATFFLYWSALGSLIGCAFQKATLWKAITLLGILPLIVIHIYAKIILEDQLGSAARAFGNFLLELDLLRFSR